MATEKGKVHQITPTETREVNERTYHSRSIVLYKPTYDNLTGELKSENYITFTVNGEEKCRELEQLNFGDVIEASYVLGGVKYADKNTGEYKYFNRVIMYKFQVLKAHTVQNAPVMPDLPPMSEPDDLPF